MFRRNEALSRNKVILPPPMHFSSQEFFEGISWHQRWEVFKGVFTPGVNSVDKVCAYVQLPEDLSDKRVLDVGAWNGCFSFECERRGASEVVAYSLENPDESGFNKLKSLLHSKVSYTQGSVYFLSPEVLGSFDVVLFFGVLYHLRYPMLAIDRIRSVCKGTAFIETHVVNGRSLLRKPLTTLGRFSGLSLLFKTTPIWRQYRAYELHPQDQSNWFGPNVQAVIESFESAGFDVIHLTSWDDRAAFRADVSGELPARLLYGTYEGVSSTHAQVSGIPYCHTGPFKDNTP
jgi:tRNA (mo5U34)-methyltransferase